MKYNTIIFDLDGTLLDTLEDISNSVNATLERYGYPTRSLEEIRDCLGDGSSAFFRYLLPPDSGEDILTACSSEYRNFYLSHMFDHTKPYDGIMELLEFLKNRNCKLAISSNKIDVAVQELTKHFFSPYINVALGAPPRHKKPDPYNIYQIVNALDAKMNDLVHIGDSEIDIETAKNIEMPGIMAAWGYRGREWLTEYGADIIADNPEDLRKILCNL